MHAYLYMYMYKHRLVNDCNLQIQKLKMIRSVEEQIENQYECLEKIGSGAFGHLILVRSRNNDQIYACKVQKSHGKKFILVQKEFTILAQLMDTKRFPEVYSFKILEQNSYMIMERLDQNLDVLYKNANKSFSLKTLAIIANQLMNSLRQLHGRGYLHRDIKPENIMTCIKTHTIKLIDFGLAEKLFAKQSVALIGNVRFCSRRAHFGFSGKKEDLESLLYVIYYFILPELPWQQATADDIKFQIDRNVNAPEPQKSFILQKKYDFLSLIVYPKTQNLVKSAFYEELHELARIIHNLKDDQSIDYSKLVHKTERLMAIIGAEVGDCYDWCPQNCPKKRPLSMYWKAIL